MADLRDWRNSLTQTTTPDKYMYGNSVANNSNMGLYQTNQNPITQQGTTTQTYSGTGGTFSRPVNPNVGGIDPMTGRRIEADTGMGGTWTSGEGGPQINNMQGYQGMKGQQQAGADVSGYQTQLRDLMSDPSKIQETTGYKFRLGQGEQAINRSAAARGQLGGGGVLAELAKYGQGMASQEYGDQVGRLSSLIGQGNQFGLQSGYYDPEQYTQTLGIKGQGGGGVRSAIPSAPQKPIDYNRPFGMV